MESYDPNKRYTWNKDAVFTMTGHQFGTILNAFRGVLNTPEAVRILTINHANEVIEEMMAANVAKGVVIEVPAQQGSPGLTVLKNEEEQQ